METQLFKNIPLFDGLSDRELEDLAMLAISYKVAQGNIILLAEEEGDSMFVIRKGRVKVSHFSEDGREVILDMLKAGEFFGEMSLLDGLPRSATIVAVEETELGMLRRTDFLQLLHKTPQIAEKLLAELTTRLRRADQNIKNLALLDVSRRLLRTLMKLGDRYGVQTQEGVMMSNRPTHQELANMTGTTRETVSRLLKQLEQKGYLTYDKHTLLLYKGF